MNRSEIAQHLIDVYDAKNKDYGNSAHRTFVEFGEVALVIRISDKLSRLQTLLSGEEQNVKDESVLDTFGDAVTYLCMLAAEIDCDDPTLYEKERLEMTDNIAQTKFYLRAIVDADIELIIPVDDIHYYRECLIGIWRGIINPETRMEEYLILAEDLLLEMEWRMKNK